MTEFTTIMANRKTLWQRIYSFFGFWTYTITGPGREQKRRVLYWCCLPWFKYYRKYDLVSWRV